MQIDVAWHADCCVKMVTECKHEAQQRFALISGQHVLINPSFIQQSSIPYKSINIAWTSTFCYFKNPNLNQFIFLIEQNKAARKC